MFERAKGRKGDGIGGDGREGANQTSFEGILPPITELLKRL